MRSHGRSSGHYAVINAGPFFLTEAVARAAVRSGVHYLDLTEDIASARTVRELAAGADKALIPQCGLAPGFVSIVANDIADRFESLDTLSMRVGALPEYPTNSLSYNLTWSTDGVINEYCEPCAVIVNGQACEVQPLEHLEEFHLDGVSYESFNTFGRAWHVGRHADRQGEEPELPDDPLPRALRHHEGAAARPAPRRSHGSS